jgi:hypothetical protein
VAPRGRDLGERGEHETAFVHPAMRQDRIGSAADDPSKIQDVEVDLAGSVRSAIDAAQVPLDAFDGREQGAGGPPPRDLGDRILEVGLVRPADWIRPVEGGDAEETERLQRAEAGKGAL